MNLEVEDDKKEDIGINNELIIIIANKTTSFLLSTI